MKEKYLIRLFIGSISLFTLASILSAESLPDNPLISAEDAEVIFLQNDLSVSPEAYAIKPKISINWKMNIQELLENEAKKRNLKTPLILNRGDAPAPYIGIHIYHDSNNNAFWIVNREDPSNITFQLIRLHSDVTILDFTVECTTEKVLQLRPLVNEWDHWRKTEERRILTYNYEIEKKLFISDIFSEKVNPDSYLITSANIDNLGAIRAEARPGEIEVYTPDGGTTRTRLAGEMPVPHGNIRNMQFVPFTRCITPEDAVIALRTSIDIEGIIKHIITLLHIWVNDKKKTTFAVQKTLPGNCVAIASGGDGFTYYVRTTNILEKKYYGARFVLVALKKGSKPQPIYWFKDDYIGKTTKIEGLRWASITKSSGNIIVSFDNGFEWKFSFYWPSSNLFKSKYL